MCRQRGRIVLSGVTGLELRRDDFYKKELSFQVSCSYGPGRYDPEYEEKGHDYPLGLVRWTEQRNFEAFLDLLAEKKLDVRPLISHRFPLEEALQAYELISTGQEPYVGILLTYASPAATGGSRQESRPPARTITLAAPKEASSPSGLLTIGFIGAGGFSGLVLLPALKKTGVRLKTIASRGGLSSTHLGKKFGFEESTTEVEKIFTDPQINTVFITTRHNTHARLVLQALQAGKNVFVEKPLCLKPEELEQIEAATKVQPSIAVEPEGDWPAADGFRPLVLMVGFNRRFAPQIQKMKSLISGVKEPKAIIMTVNAGLIPPEHWTQDPEVGGGRVLGEACHFVDLVRFLAGSPITAALPTYMKKPGPQDILTFTLNFADGSMGMVHYLSNGHKSFPKERLEVFCGGRVLQLDNFLKMRGFGWPSFKKMHLWRQDKGHRGEIEAFVAAVQGRGPNPIPLEEIFEVTRVTFGLANQK
jgi:predicted dehydrogenase